MRSGAVRRPPGKDRRVNALAAAALSMRADELAAAGARALHASSIPCLLLRGPVLARWLYDDAAERSYEDADILVPPDRRAEAAKVLNDLGLSSLLGDAAPSEQATHAETFMASGGGSIDLHWTLGGIGARPGAVWPALSRESSSMRVAGSILRIPGPATRAFIVAIHAAQHGPQGPVQLEDVKRATDRVPPSVWKEAAALAEELDALPALAAGVRRAPSGESLLRSLGISAKLTKDLAVRAQGDVPVIRGLSRLGETPGLIAKARLLIRELWPTPAFMRAWSSLARRGPLGLATAYVIRPFWLFWHLIPAYRAHRRAGSAERSA